LTDERATLTLRSSLVEQNHEVGVFVGGSDATIEATVVRSTQPRSDGTGGTGIAIESHPSTYERAKLTLRSSLLEQNHAAGVFIVGSDATIETTVIRATQPRSDGTWGHGMVIQDDAAAHERSEVALRTSLLEHNHEIGVSASASAATIETTVVRATQPRSDGTFGQGIAIVEGTLSLRASLVEQNRDVGVAVVASDATIEATVVRATQPLIDAKFGDGIAVDAAGTTTITSTKIESNARAGIASFSSAVSVVSSILRCNGVDLDGEQSMATPGQPFTFNGSKGNLGVIGPGGGVAGCSKTSKGEAGGSSTRVTTGRNGSGGCAPVESS